MKNKLLIALLALFTCVLFIGRQVQAEESEEVVVADSGYEESYLTYTHGSESPITAETSYLAQQFSGASTIIFEAEFGVTNKYVMSVVLNDSNKASLFSQSTYQKAVLLGSYKGSYLYYDKTKGGEVHCEDVSSLYNDKIDEKTLFFAKTSFKLSVSEDGSITVFAKLTDTKETYLSLGGDEETYNKLSKEYIELYKLENFYPETLIKNGYYIGFNVNMGKLMENDLILYHLEVYDYENGILFADNFSNYEFKDEKGDNGIYVVPSKTLLSKIGTDIVLTKGKEYIVPHFDVNHIKRVVNVGEEIDLSAKLVNLEGEYELTVKNGDEVISPTEGFKYTFTKQGIYKLQYVLGDVNRILTVRAVNRSTQPTVELNFTKEWNQERIDSSNASIVDGKLKLSADGYFLTKGYSEGFILNLKVNSLAEGANLHIVVGKEGNSQYALKLSENGIVFVDYDGTETTYECKNVLEDLSNDNTAYIRVELLGGVLSYSAISSSESKELLNVSLVTIKGIEYVGQVGVMVTGGDLTLSVFQFVNMTSVKDDNTNTVAPELKEEEEEPTEDPIPTGPENPEPGDNEPGDEQPKKSNKLLLIIGIVGGVLVVAAGLVVAMILIRKNKNKAV